MPMCLPLLDNSCKSSRHQVKVRFSRTDGSIFFQSFLAVELSRFLVVEAGLRKTLLFGIPQHFSIRFKSEELDGQSSFHRSPGRLLAHHC